MNTRSLIIFFTILIIFSNCSKNSQNNLSDKNSKKKPHQKGNDIEKNQFSGHLMELKADAVEGWLPENQIMKSCKKITFVHLDGSTEKPKNETNLYFFTHQGHLGLFIQCYDDDMSHLVYSHTVRDDAIWQDDNIEFNLDILPDSADDDIQICVNPLGTFSDSRGKLKTAWNSSSRVKSKIKSNSWMVQLLLPINEISKTELPSVLKANVSRTRNGRGDKVAEDTAWNKTNSLRANLPAFYGTLILPPESLAFKLIPEEKINLSNISPISLSQYFKHQINNQVVLCSPGETEIKVDGILDEQEWKFQKSHMLNTIDHRENPNLLETNFKTYYKDNLLFISIICTDHNMELIQKIDEGKTKNIWEDDSIELFLNSGRTAANEYLHFVINPFNSVIKEIGKGKIKKGQIPYLDTLMDKVQSAVSINEKNWTIEIAIPLNHFNEDPQNISSEWGFNITRFRPQKPGQPSQTTGWADLLSLDFHQPGKFGLLWLNNKNKVNISLAERIKAFSNKESVMNILTEIKIPANENLRNSNFSFLPAIIKPELVKKLTVDELNEIKSSQIKKRNENWNKIFLGQSFPSYQSEMRKKFIKSMGGFPDRTPLNTIKTLVFKCDEYEIYNILYESMPNHYVTANLYQPANIGDKKIPIIIKLIGHSTPGKNSKSTLTFADHIVRQGYALLVIDSLGQGERIYINQGNGSRTPTSNHFAMGAPCVLLGQNIAKYFIWDVIRAVDLVLENPIFDPKKIILTGSSGGGTVTSYVAALDERISGAASCSAMGSSVKGTGGHDCEQQLADCFEGDFDSMGRAAMIAPRPFTILSEYGSEENLKDNYEMIDQVKMAFRFFGKENNIEYNPTKEPHGYGRGHREIFYKWLMKYFPNEKTFSMEEKKPLFNNTDTLHVTKSWRVYYSRELNDRKTIHSMNKSIYDKIQKSFARFYQNNGADQIRQTLLETLNIKPDEAKASPIISFSKKTINSDTTIELCYIKPTESLLIPIILLYKGQNASDKIILWINQRGKENTLKSRIDILNPLINAGYTICLPDLRSMGELSEDDSVNHFSNDTDMTFYGIQIGVSYLGRIVLDAWRVEKSLKLLKPNAQVSLVGDSLSFKNPTHIRQDRLVIDDGLENLQIAESIGPLTALFLSALEPDCHKTFINGSLSSYGNIFEDFYFYHPVSTFVNGIASKIDIPEICLAIAPRKLILLNTVNAKNQLIQNFPGEMAKYQKIKEHLQKKEVSANSLHIVQGEFATILNQEFK